MNSGYEIYATHSGLGAPKHQGFLGSEAEVEEWAASGRVSDDVRAFVDNTNFETERIFVYSLPFAGSGMDDPTAKANLKEDGVLDVEWYDQCTSFLRTMDLCTTTYMAVVRLNRKVIKSVHVHGMRAKPHSFVVGDVMDETGAFATLRGLEEMNGKSNEELKALTSVSIKNADHSRILQALAYLPNLETVMTKGIRWTPQSLKLLSKLDSVKLLSVGGAYEANNFTYNDLELLTTLQNLECLDLSYTAINGADARQWWDRDEDDNDRDAPKQTPDQKHSREFARGMKTILKFPKLKELTLGAEMYPKGTMLLTKHPSLIAIHKAKNLSYQVAQILAESKLAEQLTSFGFDETRSDQLAGPILAQIAKFTNLKHLSISGHGMETLDDAAMMELAPLVNLEQLYLPHFPNTSSQGLKVFQQLSKVSVLSLGYCQEIEDGLEHIIHLPLTHLDLRSIEGLKTEHLLPVLRACPNLIDLNLRYAESIDGKALAKEANFGEKLKYLNVFRVPKAEKALKGISAEFYNDDRPFHTLPAYPHRHSP